LDWIGTFLGGTRARILGLLRRSRATIADLARDLGVSGNAVRAHLAALQRDGLVRDAGAAPSTGGKPAQVYDLTSEGEEAFPKAYAFVLGELIRALKERHGRDEAIALLRQVGRTVARQAAVTPQGALDARVAVAADALRSIGGDVEIVRTDGGWRIRGFGCPLSSVVAKQAETCRLAEELVAGITGAPVVECCDRSGSRAPCAFDIAADGTRPPRDPSERNAA
jgi:predicted ArsR family transcriptional regulator